MILKHLHRADYFDKIMDRPVHVHMICCIVLVHDNSSPGNPGESYDLQNRTLECNMASTNCLQIPWQLGMHANVRVAYTCCGAHAHNCIFCAVQSLVQSSHDFARLATACLIKMRSAGSGRKRAADIHGGQKGENEMWCGKGLQDCQWCQR